MRESVRESVRKSVRESVRESVQESVRHAPGLLPLEAKDKNTMKLVCSCKSHVTSSFQTVDYASHEYA